MWGWTLFSLFSFVVADFCYRRDNSGSVLEGLEHGQGLMEHIGECL